MSKRVSLFKVLRRELAPVVTADGFAEVSPDASTRTDMLWYFRESSRSSSLGFWFQRDAKAMFVDAVGASFTLEFFRSLKHPYDMDNRQRAYRLLTPLELEEMRSLQNRMIQRLPPLETVFKPWELQTFGSWVEEHRRVIKEPYNPLHDQWMRYRDEVDVLAWSSFIGRILPDLVRRFELAKPYSERDVI